MGKGSPREGPGVHLTPLHEGGVGKGLQAQPRSRPLTFSPQPGLWGAVPLAVEPLRD